MRGRPGEHVGGEDLAERGRVGCGEGFGDGGEIGADGGGGSGVVFDPSDMEGATAEGFEAICASAGEKVEHAGAGDALGEGGKDGGAEGVGGGAQFAATGKLQLNAAGLTASDAHGPLISKVGRGWQTIGREKNF